MATTAITLNVDNTLLPDVVAAFEVLTGWTATVPDPANPGQTIANPTTAQQNAKNAVLNYVQAVVVDYRQRQLAATATVPIGQLS